VRCFLIDI
jgi:serine/threonine protein kinase